MKVLIVAPYFAPSSEVPSVRMVSLTNYLIKQGHEVNILCWSVEKLLTLYNKNELNTKIPEKAKIFTFNSKKRFFPFIDDIVFGKRFRKTIDKILERIEVDMVFITCGPYFTLECVPYIRKKFNIPVILDFRDLGALNYRPKLGSEENNPIVAWWKKPILKWYKDKVLIREKSAIIAADKVICISEIDREKMHNFYGLNNNKFIVATNGFDEDKLSDLIPNNKTSFISCAVFGKFMYYSKRRAIAILKAISNLRSEGIDISLVHIGRSLDYIHDSIKENNIDKGSYKPLGLQSYFEGMKILGSCDFFVVEDTSPDDVGTKIYDYIYWNKPIVGAVPKDIPLAKLIASFKNGFVCDDEVEILSSMKHIINNNIRCLDDNLDILMYSRKKQNQVIENTMLSLFNN